MNTTSTPEQVDADDLSHTVDMIRYDVPGGTQFVGQCTRHHTRGLPFPTADEAYDMYVCDPLGQSFIVASGDGQAPRMTDLGGLRAAIRSAIQYAAYDNEPAPLIFRWSAEPNHLEPLTYQLAQGSQYNEHGFAYPLYVIRSAAGESIIEFTVRIDGNA